MIIRRTFSVTHMWNAGPRGIRKREDLRPQAEDFIAREIKDEDIVCISECGDEYASSITVWYRKR